MRNKVLLPTDFSKNAWQAINYATELYKNETTDFYILNVFSATGNILDSLRNLKEESQIYDIKKRNSENGLAKVLEKLILRKNSDPKHQFMTVSLFNNTIDAIKTLVEQKDIEMIIMGTRGETLTRATAFGSTAIYIMEKVRNCPVIVVPQSANLKMPEEIVFPTSFKTHYKRRELVYLTNIAKKANATIIILHVAEANELDENQKKNKQLLEEIFQHTNYIFHILSHNSVITALNIFVESRGSDMVAFINKKHTFFGSILTHSLVKEITFHLKVPILAMHDLRN